MQGGIPVQIILVVVSGTHRPPQPSSIRCSTAARPGDLNAIVLRQLAATPRRKCEPSATTGCCAHSPTGPIAQPSWPVAGRAQDLGDPSRKVNLNHLDRAQ